jgi:hypothetical protein
LHVKGGLAFDVEANLFIELTLHQRSPQERANPKEKVGKHLCSLQNRADGGDQLPPGLGFLFELFAPRGRELVVLGASIVFGNVPGGFDPTPPFQPVQRGIKGALLNLQRVAGDLLDAL